MENRRFRDCSFCFVTHSWLGSDLAAARVNHCIKVRTVAVKKCGKKVNKDRVQPRFLNYNRRIIASNYRCNRENYFLCLPLTFLFSFSSSSLTNSVNRTFEASKKLRNIQSEEIRQKSVIVKKISIFYFIFKHHVCLDIILSDTSSLPIYFSDYKNFSKIKTLILNLSSINTAKKNLFVTFSTPIYIP